MCRVFATFHHSVLEDFFVVQFDGQNAEILGRNLLKCHVPFFLSEDLKPEWNKIKMYKEP